MMLSRIDLWIGKTLFIPIIIRACQRFGVTQYAMHRMLWFVACLHGLYYAEDWIGYIVFGLGSLIMCLSAALIPNWPVSSFLWFRMLVLVSVPVIAPLVITGRNYHTIFYTLFVLFAEYAATIRTIPPLEVKEREPAGRKAVQRG
jgi:hypothetical protein